MVELSQTGVERKAQKNYGEVFENLKLTFASLVRREISRRCLLAELEGLTDDKLKDIGLDQSDLQLIRKKPLFEKYHVPFV